MCKDDYATHYALVRIIPLVWFSDFHSCQFMYSSFFFQESSWRKLFIYFMHREGYRCQSLKKISSIFLSRWYLVQGNGKHSFINYLSITVTKRLIFNVCRLCKLVVDWSSKLKLGIGIDERDFLLNFSFVAFSDHH